MELVQKYLKITGRFRKAWEIHFPQLFSQACENFARGCEIYFLQLWFHKACENFARSCEIHSQFCKACEIPSSQLRKACNPLGQFAGLRIFRKGVAKLLNVRFLLWLSSLHAWLIWQRLRSSPKLLLSLAYSLKIGNRRVICAYEHCYSMRSSDDSSTLCWNNWSWDCIDVDYWPHSSLVRMDLLHMGLQLDTPSLDDYLHNFHKLN